MLVSCSLTSLDGEAWLTIKELDDIASGIHTAGGEDGGDGVSQGGEEKFYSADRVFETVDDSAEAVGLVVGHERRRGFAAICEADLGCSWWI